MPMSVSAGEAATQLRARGHDPHDITPLKGGAWSTVFAFREVGRDYVVRFHDRRDDLEKDRFAQRWVSEPLRTPRIVEIGDLPHGAYGISERVSGTPIDDLDHAGMREVLPPLFAAMDAMREADLAGTRGFGLWHGNGAGDHASWRDTLVREDAPGERAAQRARLAASRIGAAEFDAALARMHQLLPSCPEERHLVHNDLLYFNVLTDGHGVVLLDWGASIFGDFLYEVALLTGGRGMRSGGATSTFGERSSATTRRSTCGYLPSGNACAAASWTSVLATSRTRPVARNGTTRAGPPRGRSPSRVPRSTSANRVRAQAYERKLSPHSGLIRLEEPVAGGHRPPGPLSFRSATDRPIASRSVRRDRLALLLVRRDHLLRDV